MADPIIVFNASTGSDTAASGAGPATAITGTAAAHTSGSASTTITLTNSPDLSAVATDGSHALWLDTPSGRQFSAIVGKDDSADTVTVENSFTIALASAVNYAIGGKRATLDNADSRTLFGATGARGGWCVEIETDQTLASALSISSVGSNSTGFFKIYGTGGTRPVINMTGAAGQCFNIAATGVVLIEYLKFTQSNATKGTGIGLNTGSTVVRNCVLGDATNRLARAVQRTSGTPSLKMIDCDVNNCTAEGVDIGSLSATIVGCSIYSNGAAGVLSAGSFGFTIENCIIYSNATDGIRLTSGTGSLSRLIANNVIHGNTGDGIDTSTATSVSESLTVINNSITGNGGFGWNGAATEFGAFYGWNNYGTGGTANTSGAVSNVTLASSDIQVDPGYANVGSVNFAGGANLRNQGFPTNARTIGANLSGTTAYIDIGIQQQVTSGSSFRMVNVRGGADQ